MRTFLEVVRPGLGVVLAAALLAVVVPASAADASADSPANGAGDVVRPADVAMAPFELTMQSGEIARRAAVQLKSRVALVVRADNGEVLYRKNPTEIVPIASITKLMTAIVVSDAQQSMNEVLRVTHDDIDRLKGTPSRLAVGTKLTRGEFMQLALMSSENRAASVLLRNYPGGRSKAVAAMNRKARELGMMQSRFVDGTGLSPQNRASSIDLVRLVKAADGYADIRNYSTSTRLLVKVGRRLQSFGNTNSLVRSPHWDIELTKTGFTNEAGRCLVMQARIAEVPVILVLMDSFGSKTRIGDANRVRQWLEASRPSRAAHAAAAETATLASAEEG